MSAGPSFTQNWSEAVPVSIHKAYPSLPTDRPMTCVEVGSFEGRGSLVIAELLCKHPESKLYCIDPWEDSYVQTGKEEFKNLDPLFKGQLARFQKNTVGIPCIIPMRGTSNEQIPALPDAAVDFAYIDGDHSPEQVYADGTLMFPKLKPGATMVFDDYLWEHKGVRCGDGIDRFLREYAEDIEVVSKGWHVILRKKAF
jgi:predicted O-methyltransferase YrrM